MGVDSLQERRIQKGREQRRRKRIGRRGRGYMRALKDAGEWLGQDHRRRGARRRRLSSGGAPALREV